MIHVDAVTRTYGPVRAVDDVSFRIAAGEIVGFLGPNGAGKSSLLKMLATFLPPTRGHIHVAGFDTCRAALQARARIGYLAEHNPLYERMGVREQLRFLGRAHGLRGAQLAERLDWVVERCQLQQVLRARVLECSKGFRQRIGLAAALIHDPPVLLLDEPTHGLDPLQVVALREFLHELRDGRAILFSSHILAEVLSMCDRLLVISDGRLRLDERLETLRERAHARSLPLESVVLESLDAQPPSGPGAQPR